MAILTRDQILEAVDLPIETVSVPEWGGEVMVRGLTGTQREMLEANMISSKGKPIEEKMRNMRARLLCMAIVDADGNTVFSQDDVEALGKKSAEALDRVFEIARRLSGFTKADLEEASKN